jgi:hypothetical protein
MNMLAAAHANGHDAEGDDDSPLFPLSDDAL